MKSKRPIQADIAQRAGVSRGTVSLVLNKTASRVPISEKTRERVLEAARELGYMPNPVAQMLARGRNHIIGFFTFDDHIPYTSADFYNPYLIGIELEAGNQGYNVLLFTRNRTKTKNKIYQTFLASMRLADGIVLTGNQPDPVFLQQLIQENHPFVLLGTCDIPHDEFDSVESDHQPASKTAVEYLLKLGHRYLGFVAEQMHLSHHQARLHGSENAVQSTNAKLTHIFQKDLVTAEALHTKLQQNNITALICADRSLFISLVNHLQTLSIKILQDLSLVFLSDIWNLPYTNPTRVRLNRDEAGRTAVKRLIQRFDGDIEGFQQIRIACEFIVGDTTAPPSR